ncbi:MAG: ATP-binding protein, partial [Patescibacteria group bacterium]
MTHSFSIGTKLFGAFLLIAIFGVISAYLTITNQENYVRNEKLIAENSIIIEALLEMKNVANEVDKKVVTFQSVEDSSTKKNELLANLESLDKWENEYKKHVVATNSEDLAFIKELEKTRNTIVDASLSYLSLKEQEASPAVLAAEGKLLEDAIVELKQIIEDSIIKERAEVLVASEKTAHLAQVSIRQSIILSSIAVVIALLLGFILTRLVARPIKELLIGAVHIAEGDLAQHINIHGHDELGELADAFNNMTAKLKESRTGLEVQVEETQKKATALTAQVSETEKTKAAVLNLLEDIDAEKQKAESMVIERTRELREEKARLLASINSLSFGFVLADAEDKIVLKNPALQKILELKAEPGTIHDIAEVFKAADSKIDIDIATTCKRCMELKEPVEFKEVSYGKKFLRIICTPILGTENGTIGYIFLVEDITEAKVMERSRDEFFAVASHELRTPLTAIRGNTDMILTMYADKIPDKDVKEMLQDIDASSIRLINVVNDFLEVSRLEQGKIEIKKENFAMTDVTEKVDRDLKEMITQRGLALVYVPPPAPLPLVFADKNRVEQVMVNLLGNAIKFTKAGTVTINVVQEGAFIKVRVSDTGDGISEHNQARLFRKFQQAGEDMLARDVSQSTGLGLYISRLIMNAMGGEIGLEKSELGKGSTFFFT